MDHLIYGYNIVIVMMLNDIKLQDRNLGTQAYVHVHFIV